MTWEVAKAYLSFPKPIQAEQTRLEEQKSVLLSISLSVHTFLADLSTSSDNQHKALATELKQEVVELYSLWDLCHHHTSGECAKVETCLQQLSQVLKVLVVLKYPPLLHQGST